MAGRGASLERHRMDRVCHIRVEPARKVLAALRTAFDAATQALA